MAAHTNTTSKDGILHPSTRSLFEVWDTIRQGRSAPSQNELDLRSIKDLLPNVALIERHSLKIAFSFRLAGTGLRTIFGLELSGNDFLGLWPEIEQSTIAERANEVIAQHKPSVIRFKGFTDDGRAEGMELLMLPLLSSNCHTTQIIAVIVPFTEPYWIGQRPIVRTELISMRPIWLNVFSANHDASLAAKANLITALSDQKQRPEPHEEEQIRRKERFRNQPDSVGAPNRGREASKSVAKLQLIRGGVE